MPSELPAERVRRRLGAHGDGDGGGSAQTADDQIADDGAEQPDTALSRWLPAAAPDGWLARIRADPGRAGVLALGAVGAAAVLVTVLTLFADRSPAVVSAKLPPVEPVSSAAALPEPAAPVVVSVVGLVRTPGLVTLEPGARIADALDAAGGVLDGADVLGLNMARRLADGEQIVVGIGAAPGEPVEMGSSVVSDPAVSASSPAAAPTAAGGGPAGLVDLNTATVEQLDTLPGVGPVTAAAIVSWRETNGRYASVDQLAEVDGIGPVRLAKLRDLVQAG
ncbi:MAG: ComEA family DNA-binding protein [Actinomycetota bacterium]|nr:ComEA family DNA-binding protein [Actinomycetota bacterium]